MDELIFQGGPRRGADRSLVVVSEFPRHTESPHSNHSNRLGKAFVVGLCSLSLLAPMAPAFAEPFTWQYGYDAMGRPTTVLDPNGLTTYTYYDSLGRPIQTQQPPNTGSAKPTTTSLGYDSADGVTQVTDPRNLNTTYTPNGLGEVTTQTSPDTGVSKYTYDAMGNILTKTDARGKLTQYTYDGIDRLTRAHYATGADSVFEYDGGNPSQPSGAVGQLTKITDASGQTVYTYDGMSLRTSKTQTTNGKTFTVRYSWGDNGSALDKLTAITYPSGTRVNYSYNAYGVVSAITVNPPNANGVGTNTGSTLPMVSGITRNAESKLTGWTWANGKTQAIAYDGSGQIAAYNLGDPTSSGVRRTVNRDSAGRITGYTHTSNGTPVPELDQGFGYDNLNRLTSATLSSTGMQYSYDATGNRTAKVINGTSYPNTISATSNKLTQTQDVGGTATIVHDAAGNITSDGTNTYTYSDRGRLATMTNAGGTVSYSYNALEQRVGKTGPAALVPTGATYYVYDEKGKLLGEYDANGTPLYETIYLGLPIGVIKQTGTTGASNIAISLYNVSTDQLGAPRVITRQSDEAIVWRWDSAEAFGATAPDQNPSGLGVFSFNQRLPGQVFDAESGLFQNWHREYNPRIGRYMQSDPIGLKGGINTFSYVRGDPLRFIDPLGLDRWGDDPFLKRIPTNDKSVVDWLCRYGGTGSPTAELMNGRNKGWDRYDDNLPAAERFAEMMDGNYSHYSPLRPNDFNMGQYLYKKYRQAASGGKGNVSKDADFVGKWGAMGTFHFEQNMSWADWKQRNCTCEK
jgi:RHS repeat-associated protein